MVRRYLLVVMLGILGISLGCAMCEDTYDYAYPAYGSVHPRTDRFCGRVGSDFGPEGTATTVEMIEEGVIEDESVLEPQPEEAKEPEPVPPATNGNREPAV